MVFFTLFFVSAAETYSCMNKSKLLVWFSRTSQFLLLNSLIACFFLEILSLFTWYWKIVTNYKKRGHFGKHLRYFFKYSKECRQGLKLICKYIYGLFSYLNTFAIFFTNYKKILVSKLLSYLQTYYGMEKLHLYSTYSVWHLVLQVLLKRNLLSKGFTWL